MKHNYPYIVQNDGTIKTNNFTESIKYFAPDTFLGNRLLKYFSRCTDEENRLDVDKLAVLLFPESSNDRTEDFES